MRHCSRIVHSVETQCKLSQTGGMSFLLDASFLSEVSGGNLIRM